MSFGTDLDRIAPNLELGYKHFPVLQKAGMTYDDLGRLITVTDPLVETPTDKVTSPRRMR